MVREMMMAAAGLTALAAAADAPRERLAVLAVGNSFSWSAMTYFGPVAESAGCELFFEQASLGGWTLQGHWELAEQSEADPEFRPYEENGSRFSLREKLQSRAWDVVTIQQASPLSWRGETFSPYAEKLRDYILKYAPGAEVVIQQTWSYRPEDGRLAEWGITPDEMYRRLTLSYVAAARELGLRLIPTGLAVQTVRSAAIGTFPELELVSGDYYHLSRTGEYLQACVWFAALFRRPVSEIAFRPPELPEAEAAFLRTAAGAAVAVMPQVQSSTDR